MSSTTNNCLHLFPPGEIVGAAFTSHAGLISLVAVLLLLTNILRKWIQALWKPRHIRRLAPTTIEVFFLFLFLADFVQGVGAFLDLKWSLAQRVYCSDYCTAQGIVRQLGQTGVAFFTIVITVHTFAEVFFLWVSPRSPYLWMSVSSMIWAFLGLFVGISYKIHTKSNDPTNPANSFYTPTPYWCWIGGHWLADELIGQYVWFWIAAFIDIFLYVPLYFCLRGNIDYDPIKRKIRIGRAENVEPVMQTKAGKLLWYPITYSCLVVPLSVIRFIHFKHPHLSPESWLGPASLAVDYLFNLSGVVNVSLFVLTRNKMFSWEMITEEELDPREIEME